MNKIDVREIIPLLDLEQIDNNLFRGLSPEEPRPRVFGGQVVGQALVAAYRTVSDRMAHSLHAYFLRPGDPSIPILYDVDRIRDGKSFTTRRVNAIQRGEAIFSMMVSFQVSEKGLEHQRVMPPAPDPETLPTGDEALAKMAERASGRERVILEAVKTFARPIEERDVTPTDWAAPVKREPTNMVWMRANGTLPDDPIIHQCVAAYASDLSLLDCCLVAHGRSWMDPGMQVASIDHAMWFHHPCRADQWMLYTQESPASSGARGLNLGHLYSQDGTLMISVAQEGLIRVNG